MKISQTDRKDIVATLQSEKTTVAELSSKYGVTRGRITAIYRNEAGTLLRPGKRLSPSEKEAIVAELLAKKFTVNELGARYGVTPSAISYVFKSRVGRPFKPQTLTNLSSQDKETILAELKAKKATIKELAGRFGVTGSAIGSFFRRHTGKSFGPTNVPDKEKETIIEEIRTNGTVTKQEVADKYGIHIATVERIIKQEAGKTFRSLRSQDTLHISLSTQKQSIKATKAQRKSDYRAWHKVERKMYPVLGVDWFHSRVLIKRPQELVWLGMSFLDIMKKTGLKDSKRTPEYPEGQEICVGDIIQFPIDLQGNDGVIRKTIVRGTVIIDRENGWFSIPELDYDPLVLHRDESEIIGNVHENPERIPKAA